jgi:hypothetical protein
METILKIGDAARGFKFGFFVDGIMWYNEIAPYIDKIGKITDIEDNCFVITFEDGNHWQYPISLMHLALVEEQPKVIEIDFSKVEKFEFLMSGEWSILESKFYPEKYLFTLKDENKVKIQQEIEELEAKIKELRNQL